MKTTDIIASCLPDPIISKNLSQFSSNFNKSSFQFYHNLAQHHLFELDRLVQLTDFLLTHRGESSVRCQNSDIPIHLKWSDIPLKEKVVEAISTIEKSGSWVLLYSVQNDPEYKALLDKIILELEDLTNVPLRAEITWLDAYIFVASPHSITPYHIDHESTFLFQIHGNRIANIFNPVDREILTEKEIEHYYIGDLESATYREQNQTKASVYNLVPGAGVHHPVLAPHWFQNGSSYSVAMGVHFCSKTYDKQAKIYQTNHCLRKLGLKPTSPGISKIKDWIKIFLMSLLSTKYPKNKQELLRSNVTNLNNLTKWLKTW
jgi:hypothetical protein